MKEVTDEHEARHFRTSGGGCCGRPARRAAADHGRAPLVAVCAVGIVVAVCATIIVLVRSTDHSQRLAAIKALAPALLALSSRLTGWRPPSGKS